MESATRNGFTKKIFHGLLLSLIAGFAGDLHAGPFQGFWRGIDAGDYERFLRVDADSGYNCIMDGKSSFRFKIMKDAITTPMNGMNKIEITPDSILTISGEEKGVKYAGHYIRIASDRYPEACNEEEREWYGPTVLFRPQAERVRRAGKIPRSDILGRDLGRIADRRFPDRP